MARSYRKEFPDSVKMEIRARATKRDRNGDPVLHDDGTPVLTCEGCCCDLPKGDVGEADHTIEEWTRSATPRNERKPLTADDGKLLGRCCHVPKSAFWTKERARNNRAIKGEEEHKRQLEARRNGELIRTRKRKSIPSRGFPPKSAPMNGGKNSQFKKRMDKTVQDRRTKQIIVFARPMT